MRNKLNIILLIIVIVGIFFILNKNKTIKKKDQTQINNLKNQKLLPVTNDQDFISTIVTPIDVSSLSKEWKFNISMSNHQINLDQNLVDLSTLVDYQGKEYKAIKWEGSIGGHHREGVLFFNPIKPKPKSILLKIDGINDITREFNWDL